MLLTAEGYYLEEPKEKLAEKLSGVKPYPINYEVVTNLNLKMALDYFAFGLRIPRLDFSKSRVFF